MKRFLPLLIILPLLIWVGCEDKTIDCSGVTGGTATIDDCGECVGGTTGKTACFQDCNGDWNGTAFENVCEYCVGGKTELDTTYCGTDIDGNVYNAVVIGNQVWMAENLKVTKYRDGTAIPTGFPDYDWYNLLTGAYEIYNNNSSNEADTYGNLYNWLAVNDSRNIAPEGWHIPTDDEWTILTTYLGGENVAGAKLKETDTTHWRSPNTGATNESGFTALPGGARRLGMADYALMGTYGYFWSSTLRNSGTSAWHRFVSYRSSEIFREGTGKTQGYSIRCVRD